MQTYDSIGLAGATVGVVNLDDTKLKWTPRHKDDASPETILIDNVLRATWAPIGKICHLRLFSKTGEKYRLDGFRKADIDGLKTYFDGKDIDFERENIASGGGNYGSLFVEGSVGSLVLKRDSAQVFDMNLAHVTQCVAPANKNDELDIQFDDDDENGNKEDQKVYSMRLYVPGGQAAEIQSSIQEHVKSSSNTGSLLIEFDREHGVFLAPKNRYSIEMYASFLRMHGTTFDFKVQYSDISKFYMLEKPSGTGRSNDSTQFFYFVICLTKPIRQGQQKYPYLVWQTQNEENEVVMNLSQEEINEKYPDAGLQPSMEGALHKLIGKVFKVLTGKTVFAGSRKYRSLDGFQCISCNYGQRTGVLYPNEKSFVFLHQPVIVVEFNEIEYVEFEKSEGTRNFELLIQKKSVGGENGKKLRFGALEKKEFNTLAEFIKSKDSFFHVKNYEQEAEAAVAGMDDDDYSSDEEDEDFNSGDDKAAGSGSGSGSDSDDSGLVSEDGGNDSDGEVAPKSKRTKDASSPKKRKASSEDKPKKNSEKASPAKKTKKKKDPNAPKPGKSAYIYFCDEQRPELKKTSPDLSFGDVGKKLGEMWKELDEESRAVWQDKAAEDKERFNKEMEDYVPPVQDDDDDEEEETSKKGKKAKKAKKEKDPNAPKRPMASYFLWMGENRDAIKAENPEATIGELGKIMGAKWKLLTDEEKEPFNVKAAEAKEKYNEDMKAYNAGKEGSSGGVKEEDDDDDDEDKNVKAEEDDDVDVKEEDDDDDAGMSD